MKISSTNFSEGFNFLPDMTGDVLLSLMGGAAFRLSSKDADFCKIAFRSFRQKTRFSRKVLVLRILCELFHRKYADFVQLFHASVPGPTFDPLERILLRRFQRHPRRRNASRRRLLLQRSAKTDTGWHVRIRKHNRFLAELIDKLSMGHRYNFDNVRG